MPKKKYQKSHNTGKIQIIYGLHAVRAALLNSKRVHEELYITQNNTKIAEKLRSRIKKITVLDQKDFNKLHGELKSNQGIVLKTNDFERPNLQQFLKNENTKNKSVLLVLDKITDTSTVHLLREVVIKNLQNGMEMKVLVLA